MGSCGRYREPFTFSATYNSHHTTDMETLTSWRGCLVTGVLMAGAVLALPNMRTARQAIEGFPDGLPPLTPEGVRISLQQMLNGDLVMGPIPGEAGVDFPVYNSVPDTGFDCAALGVTPPPSSVLTARSSTSSTSCATGGTTSTARSSRSTTASTRCWRRTRRSPTARLCSARTTDRGPTIT